MFSCIPSVVLRNAKKKESKIDAEVAGSPFEYIKINRVDLT
jgi:hypothetical protein